MLHIYTYDPHILVLEDDDFQRKVLVAALHSININRITEASSAEQALEILSTRSDQFDATLCDLQLGKMDGLEFIKTAPGKRLGTIILTSALPADIYLASQRVLLRKGVRIAGCLPKPVDKIDLKQMLLEPPTVSRAGRGEALVALMESSTIPRAEIEYALDHQEFIAYFQPKVDLHTRRFAGAEALARWSHPDMGLLQPSQFIDQVEQLGLIDRLTEEILKQACELVLSWPEDMSPLALSINASATSLARSSTIDIWREIVDNHGVDPRQLSIELTETTFVADDIALLETLTKLRIAGFGVSLDDFGTGYTSLKQLRTLPVTELKIDRSFVNDASTASRPAIILESIINVAKRLQISTVAEGIESEQDADHLTALGCNIGQGYFYAKPMPAEQLADWARRYNSKHMP